MRGRAASLLPLVFLAAPASARTSGPPAPQTLSRLGADGKKVTLSAAGLSYLARAQGMLENAGRRVRVEGPRLLDVLQLVGAPLGAARNLASLDVRRLSPP